MWKFILFAIAVAGVVVGALFYLTTPPSAPDSFDDANITDRCAEFRDTEFNDDDAGYALGYKGRIRQLLNGCF